MTKCNVYDFKIRSKKDKSILFSFRDIVKYLWIKWHNVWDLLWNTPGRNLGSKKWNEIDKVITIVDTEQWDSLYC